MVGVARNDRLDAGPCCCAERYRAEGPSGCLGRALPAAGAPGQRTQRLLPFAEAGEGKAQLTLSSLFRRDPAYGRFFRLYQDINLGIAGVFGDFLQMPLARTFELYELWCFLRLVRAGAETWGPEGIKVTELFIAEATGGVTIRTEAVTVPVGGGWKLCFQKQYREFWKEADGRGSYSRVMIPDVVVAKEEGGGTEPTRLIVLDAKYRIENGLPDA